MKNAAAEALLEDLEEPPYAAEIVLVAEEPARSGDDPLALPAVPFTRLSERAVREEMPARAPELSEDEATSIARVAGGRLDRAERLSTPRRRSGGRGCLTWRGRSTPTRASYPPRRAWTLLDGAGRLAEQRRWSARRPRSRGST